MARILINGIDTYYKEQGSGDEVVIYAQHGSESDIEMLSLLPPGYRVFVVDLPGYGRSTNLKEFRGFKQWSDDIYTFARKMNLGKFIYIGFSMTGIVGFQLALDHPEALKALVGVVSVPVPNVPPPDPAEQKALDSGSVEKHLAVTSTGFLFPEVTADKTRLQRRKKALEHLGHRNESMSDKEVLDFMKIQLVGTKQGREGLVPRLKEIKVPVLLLFGAQDYSNPLDQVIITAMAIPRAKAVFYQNYGHGLSLEGPEKVTDEIVLFINDLNKKR